MRKGYLNSFRRDQIPTVIQEERILDANRQNTSDDHLYFVMDGMGHVKIGRSKDPKKRLKELQTGMPCTPTITWLPNKGFLEKDFHKCFTGLKTSGEWFLYTERIKTFVENHVITVTPISRGKDSVKFKEAYFLRMKADSKMGAVGVSLYRVMIPANTPKALCLNPESDREFFDFYFLKNGNRTLIHGEYQNDNRKEHWKRCYYGAFNCFGKLDIENRSDKPIYILSNVFSMKPNRNLRKGFFKGTYLEHLESFSMYKFIEMEDFGIW